jgi:arylsulfate sulfotransferase
LLVGGRNEIYEYDMLGQQLKRSTIDENYRIHHDIIELPNGNLLMPVKRFDSYIKLDGSKIPSFNDFMILYDRETSTVLKEWDLARHLDVSRDNMNLMTKSDWLHINGLAFDARDSSILVSGKNQGLIKISWQDELQWIMAPKVNWGRSGRNDDGIDTNPFLLTAVNSDGKPYSVDIQNGAVSADDFDFPWGQHAPRLLDNGNILLFDNGYTRYFKEVASYSRAVEYRVDEKNMTVEQVWQYGKERGKPFYSMLISEADHLETTGNILVTFGFVLPHNAKIVEVNYPEGKEVFEATLDFKTLNGNNTFNWGQLDILYRSDRYELKY